MITVNCRFDAHSQINAHPFYEIFMEHSEVYFWSLVNHNKSFYTVIS